MVARRHVRLVEVGLGGVASVLAEDALVGYFVLGSPRWHDPAPQQVSVRFQVIPALGCGQEGGGALLRYAAYAGREIRDV